MSRATRVFAASLLLASLCSPAEANWLTDWWHSMQRDAAANLCWPHPYVVPDRMAVGAPFHAMVANGWRRQNLLGEHHFAPDSTKLTQAGELKVRWILTQAPQQHRIVFVERAKDPMLTARRMDAVQQAAVRVLPVGELPLVQETHIVTEGRPAAAVDRTNLQFQETMPKPQLTTTTIDTGE